MYSYNSNAFFLIQEMASSSTYACSEISLSLSLSFSLLYFLRSRRSHLEDVNVLRFRVDAGNILRRDENELSA